jgi:polyisoprenoid-binding protein YceI
MRLSRCFQRNGRLRRSLGTHRFCNGPDIGYTDNKIILRERNSAMKTITAMIAAAILFAPTLSSASSWQIDPDHSSIQFKVRHMMISNVKGQFHKFSGTVEIDDQDITRSKAMVSIDVASIDTGVAKRDEDLRSANFFDTARYPNITFTAKKIITSGTDGFKLTGDLTIHGVTREVTLDVEGPTPAITDFYKKTRRGATAATKINRKDFGMTYNKLLETGAIVVGDEVAISIEVEMIRK